LTTILSTIFDYKKLYIHKNRKSFELNTMKLTILLFGVLSCVRGEYLELKHHCAKKGTDNACGLCEGDCAGADHHCADQLQCFTVGNEKDVKSCKGTPETGISYCIKPRIRIYPNFHGICPWKPGKVGTGCDMCEGNCKNQNNRCKRDLKCIRGDRIDNDTDCKGLKKIDPNEWYCVKEKETTSTPTSTSTETPPVSYSLSLSFKPSVEPSNTPTKEITLEPSVELSNTPTTKYKYGTCTHKGSDGTCSLCEGDCRGADHHCADELQCFTVKNESELKSCDGLNVKKGRSYCIKPRIRLIPNRRKVCPLKNGKIGSGCDMCEGNCKNQDRRCKRDLKCIRGDMIDNDIACKGLKKIKSKKYYCVKPQETNKKDSMGYGV